MPRLPRPPRPSISGRGLRSAWLGRSLAFRRRAALVVLVLALYALIKLVSIPGLPCQLSPAEECPPADDAIALVPADAYAYAHANLDRDSSQFENAADLAAKLPNFETIAQGFAEALDLSGGLNLRQDLAPWIGGEAAFAEVQSAGGRARPLFVAEVGDRDRADSFLETVAGRKPPRERDYRGETIRTYRNGLAVADLGDLRALGSPASVRAAIDTEQGREESLSSDGDADSVRDPLPDDRLADAYVSADGITRLLARRGGAAAQLDTFADYRDSRGLAAALVAHDDGLELRLRSSLDPAKLKAAPGFFTAFPQFDPALPGELAPDALLYLGIAAPGETVRLLLDQARAAAPDLVDAFERFDRDLRKRGGGDLLRDVLPLLEGEAAFAIVPARPLPYLTFVFDDVDEQRAREEMANLQGPIIASLKPARTGQAAVFDQRKVDDVVMRSVRLSPALDLAYAVFDRKLVVATNPAGVRQAIEGDENLAGEDSFDTVTPGASDGVSALVFVNLEGLVKRAEPLGLNQIIRGFSGDVARLKALGLTVSSDDESLQTKLFLEIE